MELNPHYLHRPEFFEDPRFWAQLYEPWLVACVGDAFVDGAERFFDVAWDAKNEWFDSLIGLPVEEGHFPCVSVLMQLRNSWHIGVDMVMLADDFQDYYVVVPPSSDDHVPIGVHGGNHFLPALRWEEVLAISNAAQPRSTNATARALLLLYPSCYPPESQKNSVRQHLQRSWADCGLTVNHPSELIERIEQYEQHNGWHDDIDFGWVYDQPCSLRHPTWRERTSDPRWHPRTLSIVSELKATL